MDVSAALRSLVPTKQWVLHGDEYSGLEWIDSGTPPTLAEVNAKIEELRAAEPMRLLREERDRLLAKTDWVITMHKEKGTNIPAAWKTYRQALRDLPDNSTPVLDNTTRLGISGVTWPTKP